MIQNISEGYSLRWARSPVPPKIVKKTLFFHHLHSLQFIDKNRAGGFVADSNFFCVIFDRNR